MTLLHTASRTSDMILSLFVAIRHVIIYLFCTACGFKTLSLILLLNSFTFLFQHLLSLHRSLSHFLLARVFLFLLCFLYICAIFKIILPFPPCLFYFSSSFLYHYFLFPLRCFNRRFSSLLHIPENLQD